MAKSNTKINPDEIIWDEQPQINSNEIVWDEPTQPKEQPMSFKKIGQIMTSGAKPLRQALYGGEGLDASARKMAMFNALARMVSAPFSLGIEGLKQIPYIGEGVAAPYELPGQAVGSMVRAVSPSVLPDSMSQQKRDISNELMTNLGTMALFKGVQSIPKAVGATARTVLPPAERMYSPAAKLGSIGAEADAATYGVKNRVLIGGGYKFQPKNYENIQTKIKATVEQKLNPTIEKINQSGVALDRAEVLQQVNDYLKQNYAGLKTPAGKARYQKVLDSLNEEFKQGNEKITPKEMQEGKVATHREATYDAEGQMTNEFNKAVAHIYRKQLETWAPELKTINKELLNLDVLGESIYNEAMRSSKSLPKGEMSAPFYIAITNPLRGAAIAGARGFLSTAAPLSRTAFLIDWLQQRGIKPDVTKVK